MLAITAVISAAGVGCSHRARETSNRAPLIERSSGAGPGATMLATIGEAITVVQTMPQLSGNRSATVTSTRSTTDRAPLHPGEAVRAQ
jgi:hypothetical protein